MSHEFLWLRLLAAFNFVFLVLSKRSASIQTLRGGCAQDRIPEDTRHWSLDAQAPTGVSSPTSIALGRRRIRENPERNAVVYFRLSEEAAASRDAADLSQGKETVHEVIDYTFRNETDMHSVWRSSPFSAITHERRSLDKSVIFCNKMQNWFYGFN